MLTLPFLNLSAALITSRCLPTFSFATTIERVNFALFGLASFFPSSFTRIVFASTRVIETKIEKGLAVQVPWSGVPSVWMCGLRPPLRQLAKLKVDRRFVPLLYSRTILTV